MPRLLESELKQFETQSDPMNQKRKRGEGLGSLFNTIWQNKELIGNIAKGVGSIGTATAAISQATKSKNELDKIKEIREMRERARERSKK